MKDFPEITFLKGANVTDLSQDEEGVTVTYTLDGQSKTARASNAVGCDGARSGARTDRYRERRRL